jgi:hypothetical protein
MCRFFGAAVESGGEMLKDETFYTVAAATIPVYFLALTFQGTLFNTVDDYLVSLLNSNEAFYREWTEKIQAHEPIKLTKSDSKKIAFHGLRAAAIRLTSACVILIVALSAVGEFIALQCLYSQTAEPLQHQVVLLAVQVLTVGTAAFLAIRIYLRIYTAKYRVFRLFFEQLNQYIRTP